MVTTYPTTCLDRLPSCISVVVDVSPILSPFEKLRSLVFCLDWRVRPRTPFHHIWKKKKKVLKKKSFFSIFSVKLIFHRGYFSRYDDLSKLFDSKKQSSSFNLWCTFLFSARVFTAVQWKQPREQTTSVSKIAINEKKKKEANRRELPSSKSSLKQRQRTIIQRQGERMREKCRWPRFDAQDDCEYCSASFVTPFFFVCIWMYFPRAWREKWLSKANRIPSRRRKYSLFLYGFLSRGKLKSAYVEYI